MTAQEMLRTLGNCSCAQPYKFKESNYKTPPINWFSRMKTKRSLFLKSLLFLFLLALVSGLFVILPCYIASSVLGKTLLISMFPMLLVTLSWMAPAWIFFDKRKLVLTMTVGMMPLRIMFVLGFVYLIITHFPMIHIATLGVGMMGHWILFFIAETYLMIQYGKLPRTAEEQPD